MKPAMPGILAKRLFHKCIRTILSPLDGLPVRKAVDAEGYMRETVRMLMAWIADMEEQWMITTLGAFTCPHCTARKNNLDNHTVFPDRTAASILQTLKDIRAKMPRREGVEQGSMDDTWAFVSAAKKIGLRGVEEPFWKSTVHETVDICRVLSGDLLHTYHKCFSDHIVTWTANILNTEEVPELDVRLRLQITRPGFRHFGNGKSSISQWTQGNTRDLKKEFIGVISGAPAAMLKLIQAVRAHLDYIYLATYTCHTSKTL